MGNAVLKNGSEGRENVRFLASVVTALCLVVIAPLFGWGLHQFVTFAREVESRISVLEDRASVGRPYTQAQAERDLKPIVEKVNDHELRIRTLEDK